MLKKKSIFQSTNKKTLENQLIIKGLQTFVVVPPEIEPGTLQNLRIKGTLPYTKIGRVIYYDHDEIKKILEDNRIHNKF